jgi:hypothetical protein
MAASLLALEDGSMVLAVSTDTLITAMTRIMGIMDRRQAAVSSRSIIFTGTKLATGKATPGTQDMSREANATQKLTAGLAAVTAVEEVMAAGAAMAVGAATTKPYTVCTEGRGLRTLPFFCPNSIHKDSESS